MMKKYFIRSCTLIIVLGFTFISVSKLSAQFTTNTIQNTTFLEFDERIINYYPIVHYNRVEGAFLGAGAQLKLKPLAGVTVLGEAGYGFANEEYRYRAGFFHNLFSFNKLRLGANVFHQTATLDDWLLTGFENSIHAIFDKHDYRDYFSKKGYKIYANQFFTQQRTQVRLEVTQATYESMEKATDWSLLRKDDDFRSNPAITPGDETSYRIIMSFDTRDNPIRPRRGSFVDAIYEITRGDFDTQGIFLNSRSYQPVGRRQQINTRIMIGARNSSMAEQHVLDLGGLGTLPGFDDKEFQNGNRFMMYNFRYLFHGALLQKLPFTFIPFYESLGLSLFFNSGWLFYETEDGEFGAFPGFEKVQFRKLKTDVGFSLSAVDDYFRIDIAKRTDRSRNAWRVLARFLYRM